MSPTYRESLLRECWQSVKLLPEGAMPSDSAAIASLLHKALRQENNPRTRHLAFMMLQHLGGRPPSLFKEVAEGLTPTGMLQEDSANLASLAERTKATFVGDATRNVVGEQTLSAIFTCHQDV